MLVMANSFKVMRKGSDAMKGSWKLSLLVSALFGAVTFGAMVQAADGERWAKNQKKFDQLLAGGGNIHFESSRAVLKRSSYKLLNRLVAIAKDCPCATITIEGHTDASGNDDANMVLSEQRARAVLNYMLSRGVRRSKLIAVGYGENRPIATNETPEGRAKNRRIQFVVTKINKVFTASKAAPKAHKTVRAAAPAPVAAPVSVRAPAKASAATGGDCGDWVFVNGAYVRGHCGAVKPSKAVSVASATHKAHAVSIAKAKTNYCGDSSDLGPADPNAPKWMNRRQREGDDSCEVWVSSSASGGGSWKSWREVYACREDADYDAASPDAPKWMVHGQRNSMDGCEVWTPGGENGGGMWKLKRKLAKTVSVAVDAKSTTTSASSPTYVKRNGRWVWSGDD